MSNDRVTIFGMPVKLVAEIPEDVVLILPADMTFGEALLHPEKMVIIKNFYGKQSPLHLRSGD